MRKINNLKEILLITVLIFLTLISNGQHVHHPIHHSKNSRVTWIASKMYNAIADDPYDPTMFRTELDKTVYGPFTVSLTKGIIDITNPFHESFIIIMTGFDTSRHTMNGDASTFYRFFYGNGFIENVKTITPSHLRCAFMENAHTKKIFGLMVIEGEEVRLYSFNH